MKTQQITPQFGVNYDVGYIGFTRSSGNIVSCGITYFTRWFKLSEIAVSHALVVTGEDECVEALPSGVEKSKLSKYFNGSNVQIFFRQPRGWTQEMGERIRQAAYKRVGRKYGYSNIAGQAVANSILGKVLSAVTFGWFGKAVLKVTDSQKTDICDETAYEVLKAQPELSGAKIFYRPSWETNPQQLFEDEGVFEPWKQIQNGG